MKTFMEKNPELEDYDLQTQRLVMQMQNDMKEVWHGSRGATRQKRIREFNLKIANVIEWKARSYKKQLQEAMERIQKLNECLDKCFEKKWDMRDRLQNQIDKLEQTINEHSPRSDTSAKTGHPDTK